MQLQQKSLDKIGLADEKNPIKRDRGHYTGSVGQSFDYELENQPEK